VREAHEAATALPCEGLLPGAAGGSRSVEHRAKERRHFERVYVLSCDADTGGWVSGLMSDQLHAFLGAAFAFSSRHVITSMYVCMHATMQMHERKRSDRVGGWAGGQVPLLATQGATLAGNS
jgi:hypothetical protein